MTDAKSVNMQQQKRGSKEKEIRKRYAKVLKWVMQQL
jgi:hypothetical protein